MKNNFIIDSDEKQRILSLHENSTKNQYLNLIMEGPEGLNYKTDRIHTFISAVGGKKIQVDSEQLVTVDQTYKKLNIGKYFKFSCKPKIVSGTPFHYTDMNGKVDWGNEGSALTNVLKKRYCNGENLKSNEEILGKKNQQKTPLTPQQQLERAQKCGYKTWDEYKGAEFACNSKNNLKNNSIVGGKVVIPKDIDLSQITKDLPTDLQTVLTPPTIDGQPNTSGVPDFNQLLTQLQGLQ